MAMEEKYDVALLGILQHEGKIEKFLNIVLGFLYRRTDFYRLMKDKKDKLGFPPGVALKMLTAIFKEYDSLTRKDDEIRLAKTSEGEQKKKKTGSKNVQGVEAKKAATKGKPDSATTTEGKPDSDTTAKSTATNDNVVDTDKVKVEPEETCSAPTGVYMDVDSPQGSGDKNDDRVTPEDSGTADKSDTDSCESVEVKSEPVEETKDKPAEEDEDSELARNTETNRQSMDDPIDLEEETINLCQQCGKTFKHPRSLKRHENSHKGQMPYHCCGQKFADHIQFVRHRRDASREFLCMYCGASLKTSNGFRRHKRTHELNSPYRCCGKLFFERIRLQMHRQQKVFQASADSYNGAVRDNYSWSQSINDVDVKVNVPSHVKKGRDCQVEIQKKRVRVGHRDEGGGWKTVVDGELTWEVDKEESMWSLNPGQNIHINLEKKEERWWEAVLTDEPKISVRKIDASRPMTDLDDEAQAKIEEMMYNDRQKKLGKPQSHEQKMYDTLKTAWDAEGSPFKGQPFDPSKLNVDPSGVINIKPK